MNIKTLAYPSPSNRKEFSIDTLADLGIYDVDWEALNETQKGQMIQDYLDTLAQPKWSFYSII